MSFHPREIYIWRHLCEIETGWDGGSEIEVAQEGEVLKLGLLIFPAFFHILLYFAPSGVLSLLAQGRQRLSPISRELLDLYVPFYNAAARTG